MVAGSLPHVCPSMQSSYDWKHSPNRYTGLSQYPWWFHSMKLWILGISHLHLLEAKEAVLPSPVQTLLSHMCLSRVSEGLRMVVTRKGHFWFCWISSILYRFWGLYKWMHETSCRIQKSVSGGMWVDYCIYRYLKLQIQFLLRTKVLNSFVDFNLFLFHNFVKITSKAE